MSTREREREERRYIHTQLAHVVTVSISCVFLFEQEVGWNMLIPWCEFLAGDGKYFWLVNVEFHACISNCHLLVSYLLTSFWQSGLMYCTYRKCKMYESPVFISYHNDCMSYRYRECRTLITLIKFSAMTLLTFMLYNSTLNSWEYKKKMLTVSLLNNVQFMCIVSKMACSLINPLLRLNTLRTPP